MTAIVRFCTRYAPHQSSFIFEQCSGSLLVPSQALFYRRAHRFELSCRRNYRNYRHFSKAIFFNPSAMGKRKKKGGLQPWCSSASQAATSSSKPMPEKEYMQALVQLVSAQLTVKGRQTSTQEETPLIKASRLIAREERSLTVAIKKCWTLRMINEHSERKSLLTGAHRFHQTLNVLHTQDNVFMVCEWLFEEAHFRLGQQFYHALEVHREEGMIEALLPATLKGLESDNCSDKDLCAIARMLSNWIVDGVVHDHVVQCFRMMCRRADPAVVSEILCHHAARLVDFVDQETALAILQNIWNTKKPFTDKVNLTLSTFRKFRSIQKPLVQHLSEKQRAGVADLCIGEWGLYCDFPEAKNTPLKLPDSVSLVMVDCEDVAKEARYILSLAGIVGLDMESKPMFKAGQPNKVALLQVATRTHAFLFDLPSLKADSTAAKCIEMVLQSKDILKIGMDFKHDLQTLHKSLPYSCFRMYNNLVELGTIFGFAYNKGNATCAFALRKQVHLLLGQPLSKKEQMSNWTKRPLTSSQQHYAALDAHVLITATDKLLENKEVKAAFHGFKESYEIQEHKRKKVL